MREKGGKGEQKGQGNRMGKISMLGREERNEIRTKRKKRKGDRQKKRI